MSEELDQPRDIVPSSLIDDDQLENAAPKDSVKWDGVKLVVGPVDSLASVVEIPAADYTFNPADVDISSDAGILYKRFSDGGLYWYPKDGPEVNIAGGGGGAGDNLGNHTATQPLRMISGSALTPALSFNSDPDTGMYRSQDNTLDFATDGIRRMSIRDDGLVTVLSAGYNTLLGQAQNGSALTTKTYVDGKFAALPAPLRLTGGTMSGDIDMAGNDLTSVANITADVVTAGTLISIGVLSGNTANVSGDITALNITANGVMETSQLSVTSQAIIDRLKLSPGSDVLPSLAFELDFNTGLYQSSSGVLDFAAGGVRRMSILANGLISVPSAYTSALTADLTGLILANKAYVDTAVAPISGALQRTGGTMTGSLNMGSGNISAVNVLTATTANFTTLNATGASTLGKFSATVNNSANSPIVYFESDSNTGLYHSADDTLDFSTAGINRLTIDPDGKLVVPAGYSATANTHLTNKAYVDTALTVVNNYLLKTGGTMTGSLAMSGANISGVNTLTTSTLTSTTAAISGAATFGSVTASGTVQGSQLTSTTAAVSGAVSMGSGSATGTFTANLIQGNSMATGIGAVSAPGYAFSTDANTGMYSSATDTLDFTTGGVRAFSISSAGLIRQMIDAATYAAAVATDNHIPNRRYLTDNYLPLSGGTVNTLTIGNTLTLNADPSTAMQAATKQYADALAAGKLSTSGGTLTGPLILPNDTPTNALYAVTKQYVDSVTQGISVKAPCRVKTNAVLNYTASGVGVGKTLTENPIVGPLQIDGVTLSVGNRVLVDNDGTAVGLDRGIYTVTAVGNGVAPWVLTRATDADQTGEINSNMYMLITEGTVSANSGYILTTANPITVDVTSLSFAQFSSGAGSSVSFANVGAGTGIYRDTTGTVNFKSLASANNMLSITDGDTVTLTVNAANINSTLSHNSLSGLTTGNPHTQYLLKTGGTMVGTLDMGSSNFQSLGLVQAGTMSCNGPANFNDAVTVGSLTSAGAIEGTSLKGTRLVLTASNPDNTGPGNLCVAFGSASDSGLGIYWNSITSTMHFVAGSTSLLAIDDSGRVTVTNTPDTDNGVANKAYVDARVLKSGDTMTGALVLSGGPTLGTHAANKTYVDTKLALAGGTLTGALNMSNQSITAVGSITSNATISTTTDMSVGTTLLLSNTTGNSSTPSLRFGNAQRGIYTNSNGDLIFTTNVLDRLTISVNGGIFAGSAYSVSSSTHLTHKSYVDTQVATALPLAGGTLTGMLQLPGTTPTLSTHAITKGYFDSNINSALVVQQFLGFQTGTLTINTWGSLVILGNDYNDAFGSDITLQLPSTASQAGKSIVIKRLAGGVGKVTLSLSGTTITAPSAALLNFAHGALTLVCRANNFVEQTTDFNLTTVQPVSSGSAAILNWNSLVEVSYSGPTALILPAISASTIGQIITIKQLTDTGTITISSAGATLEVTTLECLGVQYGSLTLMCVSANKIEQISNIGGQSFIRTVIANSSMALPSWNASYELVNSSSSGITITLPSYTGAIGKSITLKRTDVVANNTITLAAPSGQTLNLTNANIMNTQFNVVQITCVSSSVAVQMLAFDNNPQALDGSFRVSNTTNNTKKLAFDVSNVTAGQTRTATVPNHPVLMPAALNGTSMALGNTSYSSFNDSRAALFGVDAGKSITTAGLAGPGVSPGTTAIGYKALTTCTTGSLNTSVGSESLTSLTEGDGNQALGMWSLFCATTSSYNTAMGFAAGFTINGSGNTAIGTDSMGAGRGSVPIVIRTGDNNVGVGREALYSVNDNSNTAVGAYALRSFSGANNTAVGYEALSSTTVTSNLAVGYQALKNNTSGGNNLAIGASALLANITGAANLAIGISALTANTGDYNVAIGESALIKNTTGSLNVALGGGALYNNNGNANVAIGDHAMPTNSSGSRNVAVGSPAIIGNNPPYRTLGLNASGSDNMAIGTAALNANTASNNVALGTFALFNNTTGTPNLAIGVDALKANTIGVDNLAIGYQALAVANNSVTPTSPVSNNFAIGPRALAANTTGTPNFAMGVDALKTNTTGAFNVAIGFNALKVSTASNNFAIGPSALVANTTGTPNFAMGVDALKTNTTGAFNFAVGYQALRLNTASNNFAMGANALAVNVSGDRLLAIGASALTANTDGVQNFAIGYQALTANSQGDYNFALGDNALAANTLGSSNFAMGTDALKTNTTGVDNLAIGVSALTASNAAISNNFAIGPRALAANTTGTPNFAMGVDALRNNTTGGNNLGIGYNALRLNTTGGSNTAVGVSALAANVSSTGNTAVGYKAGALLTSTGNTLLGASAGEKLTTGENNTLLGSSAGANLTTGSDNILIGLSAGINIEVGAVNAILIGNTGDGNDSDTIKIGVEGVHHNTYIHGIRGETITTGIPVYVGSTGRLAQNASSRRYKNNIVDMEDTSRIYQLRPVNYFYNESDDVSRKQYGLIAEEVNEVIPEIVVSKKIDGVEVPDAVQYHLLIPMLLNELTKLRARVIALEAVQA